jgi:hypothetical protein
MVYGLMVCQNISAFYLIKSYDAKIITQEIFMLIESLISMHIFIILLL